MEFINFSINKIPCLNSQIRILCKYVGYTQNKFFQTLITQELIIVVYFADNADFKSDICFTPSHQVFEKI